MTETNIVPVPLVLEKPSDQWRSVEPAANGAPHAALLMLRRVPEGQYTPTLTVSGAVRDDGASLEFIANEAIATFAVDGIEVSLIGREQYDEEPMHGITQSLGCSVPVDGVTHEMRAIQVIAAYPSSTDPKTVGIVIHTVTCTEEQLPLVAAEFKSYLRSVRLDVETE